MFVLFCCCCFLCVLFCCVFLPGYLTVWMYDLIYYSCHVYVILSFVIIFFLVGVIKKTIQMIQKLITRCYILLYSYNISMKKILKSILMFCSHGLNVYFILFISNEVTQHLLYNRILVIWTLTGEKGGSNSQKF